MIPVNLVSSRRNGAPFTISKYRCIAAGMTDFVLVERFD
ncbi:hypothetical protein SXCC_00518 [Gluconacetobacter sp. SXCC-1]|nr:hypothetical protein SXCC_00518 [Gluconacetobacter sp. SXCC-1]